MSPPTFFILESPLSPLRLKKGTFKRKAIHKGRETPLLATVVIMRTEMMG